MTTLEAIILGIIQGLTEFLPVSSSGHLVLLQQLLGLKEAELFFDVCVHLGTLAAVIIVFRQDIKDIVMALWRLFALAGQKGHMRSTVRSDPELKMALLIVIGSIPTALLYGSPMPSTTTTPPTAAATTAVPSASDLASSPARASGAATCNPNDSGTRAPARIAKVWVTTHAEVRKRAAPV